MSINLSRGVLQSINDGATIESIGRPVIVQVINTKMIPPSRQQLLISDGVTTTTAVLSTQTAANTVVPNSCIRIIKFVCNNVANQKVLIILDLENLGINESTPLSSLPPSNPTSNYQQPMNPAVPQVPQQSYNQQLPFSAPAQQQQSIPSSYQQQSTNLHQQQSYQPPQAPPQHQQQDYQQSMYQQKQTNLPAPVTSSYGNSNNNSSAYRPVYKDENIGGAIVPIRDINPYSQKWTIKARVTSKTDLKKWSNAKGEGTLFSIDLLDNEGGEIRATFFKDACDKFFPILEEGRVYTFSGGQLKVVQNRQYTTIKNQYELTFSIQSVISAASDDSNISRKHINEIDKLEVNSTIDVIAVVRSASEVTELVSQKLQGKQLQKRDLVLMDDTMHEIRLTLWGDKATGNYDWHSNPILAIKACKIGDYQGRTLGSINNTSIALNPDIEEGKRLFQWKTSFNGALPSGTAMSSTGPSNNPANDAIENRITLQAIREQGLGQNDKPDYVTVCGTVTFIKHDAEPWYTACSQPSCNKKVVEGQNGVFYCDKCNVSISSCIRRYILNLTISDNSGNHWVTLFNEQAEKLLGISAQDLYELRSMDGDRYEAIFANALFSTHIAKLRVKQELVQDEMKLKASVQTLSDFNYASECAKLIQAINKYQ